MTRLRYGVAALAVLAFLLSGCAGGSSSGSASERAAAPDAAAPKLAEQRSGRGNDQVGGDSADAAGRRIVLAPADRAIVSTAELTVRAAEVASAVDRAKAIVSGAGGYVAEEKSDTFGTGSQSVVTFKVPPSAYPDVLARLGREVGRRESMHQSSQDVTEEVADVDSRVRSAKAALDQFRTLLAKANKIGEILEIEREIANREAELEALQARQRALAARTSMATITLTVLSSTTPITPEEPPTGFLAGLRAGWQALVSSAEVALTVLGALLPWLTLGGVVWLAVLLVVRRVRARRTASGRQPSAQRDTPSAPTSAAS